MIVIPQQGKFTQSNRGDIFGNVNRTQNIDFKTSPGKLKISPRLTINTKSDDGGISNMGVPLAFVAHTISSTKQYWTAAGIGTSSNNGTGTMLVSASTTPQSVFANDVTSNTPTTIHADYSDMVEWTNGLFVSKFGAGASNISRLIGSWTPSWFTATAGGSFTVNGGLKNMEVGFNGNLYITDDDLIIYVNTAGSAVLSGTGTIDFNGAYRAIWIRSSSKYLWIGLMSFDASFGTKGFVAQWTGTGTAPDAIYNINAPCALSCTILDDVPYIIDAYGRLKKFNGTGFVEIERLPVANQNIEMPGIYNDLTNSRWIHQRGMDVVDGKINILVNNFVSTGVYVEDMPSGIWEYDPQIGLYHKNAPCITSIDWGQQSLLTTGAIYGTKRSTATYLAGLSYYTDDATTSKNAIFYDDIATDTNKRGIILTPFLSSNQIQDTWQKVNYRFTQLPSGDKIIGKFRTMKKANLPFVASITWTSTSSFSSSNANFQYVSVGEEIEIIMGTGASTTAHISAIQLGGASTYIVTLDEAIGPSSGTGKVKANNFKKMGTISNQNIDTQSLPVMESDIKVQIKTEMRVTGAFELDDLTLISQIKQITK